MKKIILGIFVILLMTQIITAHRTKSIRENHNIFENINFVLSEAFSGLTAALYPTTGWILSSSFSLDSKLHSSITIAIDALSIHATSLDYTIGTFNDFLSTQDVTPHSIYLSKFAISLHQQSVIKITGIIHALGQILNGQQPNSVSFTKLEIEAVNEQAKAFLAYSIFLLDELKDLVNIYDVLNQEVGANCSCPSSTSIKPIIDLWLEVNQKISSYLEKTCRKWTLGEYLSKTSSIKLALAVNATNDLLENLASCSECLIKNAGNENGTFYDQICDASKTNAFKVIASKYSIIIRESEFLSAMSFIERITLIAENINEITNSRVSYLTSKIKRIRHSHERKSLKHFIESFSYFQDILDHSIKYQMKPILKSIHDWNDITATESEKIITEIENFAKLLSNDSKTCANCMKFVKSPPNGFNFIDDFKKCGRIIEKDSNGIKRKILADVKILFKEFAEIVREIEYCVKESLPKSSGCHDALFSFNIHPKCIEKVSKKIVSTAHKFFNEFDNLINETSLILDQTTLSYQSCINIVDDKLQSEMKKFEAMFKSCANIFASIDQLKLLEAQIANSSANPACLEPIKSQITQLLDVLNSPTLAASSSTPDSIAQIANGFQDTFSKLNSSFNDCANAPTASKYPLPNLCVTWKPYLNDSAPATDGYLVGNYTDGSKVYVGFGYVPNRNSQFGRLKIDATPTLFLTVPQGSASLVQKDILYMSVSPNCTCSWDALNFTTSGIIMGGMVIQDGAVYGTPFFISLVTLTNGVTIARSRIDTSFYYANENGGESSGNGATTALACNPKSDTTVELQAVVGETVTDTLVSNQCLFYGHSLTSANGCFKLTFKTDGNLVITKKGNDVAIFETKTANMAAFQVCLLQNPGNLIIYSTGAAVFDTKTSSGNTLKLENDGNLVLYAGSTNIWSSKNSQSDSTC